MADHPPSSTSNNQGSPFVNSEPIREDQVQNAVKFLSHPKVRGSPVIHRRSFLERKGLTKEEIDEAFRRVPDETPAVTATQSPATNQDGQIGPTSNNVQQQSTTQITQPAAVTPISKMSILSRFQWHHALASIVFLAVSGAGTVVLFKKSIVPKVKSWIRKIALEEVDGEGKSLVKKEGPSITEEAATAAKACAAAASDVARVVQEMMTPSKDKRYFEELVSMLNMQMQELKTMNTAIQKLEGQSNPARVAMDNQQNKWISGINSRQPYSNGKVGTDSHSGKRGELPSYTREINNTPPNPNQPVSNPRLAPPSKPWKGSQSSYNYTENPIDGDETAPFWQQKNVRITETESGEERRLNSSSSNDAITGEERRAIIRRSWVPPQPPPVAMPEAAAAIRQPKKSSVVQTEQLNDEQPFSHSNTEDEVQRSTEISEMAKEENGSYLEA